MNAARAAAAADLIAEAVRSCGSARFRVLGSSMRPMIRSGDFVHVERAAIRQMRPGQIAVFQRAGALFAHRVIRQAIQGNEAVLITKGDAFPEADEPVFAHELVGRVSARVRGTRPVSLEALSQRVLGQTVAYVSAAAPLWYPHVRGIRRMLRASRG